MARCTERGVDPVALQRIGRLSGRPEWLAAGQFAQQYEQTMLLRSAVGMAAPQATVPALGAAELVGAALEAFAVDPELLAAERGRVKLLLVDDAQHLDPQAARLVRALAASAELTVIAGDPNQAVFSYRGADPALLHGDGGDPVITLTESHRCAPAVAHAITGIARRLPGAGPARELEGTAGGAGFGVRAGGRLAARRVGADRRRAAAEPTSIDEVPWSQMAVIVRSVRQSGAALSRALTAAGVPVVTPPSGVPPADQPAARAMLTVLAAAADGLDGDRALDLLTGPIGRVDPVSLRQLRRALRRADRSRPPRDFGDLLVGALESETVALSGRSGSPVAAGARRARGRAAQ